MDYIQIATEFVNEHFPGAQGAILSGSAVTGEMKPGSDLDILIFYSDLNTHYRKVCYYQGIKVEAMAHKISECKHMFKSDQKKRNRSFLDLVTKGKILKDTEDKIKLLIEEAKELYNQPPAPFTPYEKNLYHYILSNRLDDLKDAETFHEAYFIFNNMLHFITKYMLISEGKWTNKGDGKWQLRSLMEHDEKLTGALLQTVDSFVKENNRQPFIDLITDTLLALNPDPDYLYEAGIPPQYNLNRKWCMIEVYYADGHDELLVNAIKPLMSELKETFGAEATFFSRSFKNGSHVSVYVIMDETTFVKEVIPHTDNVLGEYLSMNPSLRFIPDMYKRLSKRYQMFENNSIQYHTFESDAIKFMGHVGLQILEKQFDVLSQFVLETLEQNEGTNYNDKVGELLKFAWSIMHSLGLSVGEINLFFGAYWNSWGTYQFSAELPAILFHDKVTNDIPLPPKLEKVKELSFKGKFENQKDRLLQYVPKLSEQLDSISTSLDPTLIELIEKLKDTNRELETALQDGHLFLPDPKVDDDYGIKILEEHPLWFFYKEIIHALFNRFGVVHENEAYAIYLLKELAAEMEKSKAVVM